MLRRKNMTQILMFVYFVVTFLSLFLLVTSRSSIPCKIEADCPDELYYFIECVDGFCVYWRDE
ncbi:unnamed protein product [Trifolium pratense]|uniref:Uncharacterized protein n=1 Tax=Trifolium pratense TaxID=57577 RepID=A0ACB0MCX4_TRIPR|nr:unnamed protein product [Trifolium pratense]